MLNLFRYVGLRHLQLKPMRSFLTLMGVAFGISLYVAIAIINHSTQNSMRESIEAVAGKAKITVTSGPVGFDESKVEIIKQVAGVAQAVPMIEARAFFAGAKESTDGLFIMGVDLLQEQGVRTYKTTDQKVIDDPLIFLNQPDSIILTKSLAEKRGLKLDSKLSLATANGLKNFTVRGLLEPEGAARAYGGSLAIMDIDGARVTFGRENKVDRMDIVPVENYSIDALKQNLSRALGPAFKVETPDGQSHQMEAMITSYQLILTFFSSIALLVGLFLIINSISVSVAERRKEIGTLRALGATKISMVTLFVSEVIGVGFFGSALGCVMGRFLAGVLSKHVSASLNGQLQMQINVTQLEFTHEQIIYSILLGTGASVLAAFWPSLKAARIHPLESMRVHVESRTEKEEHQARNLIIIGFFILIYVTLAAVFNWQKYSIIFDLLGKAGCVLGTAIFGPFVVLLLLKGLGIITRKSKSTVLRLSQENLLRSPKRTSSNVMALLVGLFLVMLIATVRSSFHDTLMNWFGEIFVSDLLIASNGRIITADVQPLREEIQNEILKTPGIRQPGPGRGIGYRLIRTDYNGTRITIKALDHYAEWYQAKNYAVTQGDRVAIVNEMFASKVPALLASDSFLLKQHKKVGDFITVNSPSGPVPFKILGVVTDYASPDGVFYMNRAVYIQYWKDHLVTGFVVDIEKGHPLEEVRSAIERELGKKDNLVVISNAEFRGQMQDTIERSFAYTKAIEWIALIVGLLGLLNTLLISVMERTREIGMLRAVGATRSQISRMIFGEAVLQGFFGACVAVVMGGYIGWIFVKYSLTASLGWIVEYHFAYGSIATTLLTGVIVAMIAGILPAHRASSLPITEALDHE